MTMFSLMIIYSIIFVLLLIAELLYFRIADKFNIIDKPNERSSHTSVVLRGGGIIFLIGVWVWSLFYGFHYPWFLAGLTLVAGVSFVDDIRSLPDSLRLAVQFVATVMAFYQLDILHIELWWVVLLALIVYVSQKVKGNVTLLIIGVMIGYVSNAVIGVLKFFSVEEDIRAYVIWGLGSFSRVSGNQMMLFVTLMAILLPLSFLLIKTLNLMLLGDGYARNLGLNIKRARLLVIVSAGVLTAIVTAYCGPIIFLGLAVPHLARAMFQTSDHRTLMPATLLLGAALALICNLLARMPGFEGALPVNSVTALVGAPVVASVLFNKRKNDWNE